jgi:hypothetical protein
MIKPIKSMMISGNVFDLMKKVDGMGRDNKSVDQSSRPRSEWGYEVTPGGLKRFRRAVL